MRTKTGDTRPDEPLAAEVVRATIYTDLAIANAELEDQGTGPDALVEGMHGDAFFILDHCAARAGVAAARGAMIELAARRLAGTRRIER